LYFTIKYAAIEELAIAEEAIMKILVAVKRVVDYNIKVRVKPDGSDVDIDGVKMGVNPFDENAIEEALRLKEQGKATEVVAVSFGTQVNQDVLRHALAMGADRAILVESTAKLQSLPAVITADLRLNEPRFVKLPNLMMARKKPIETINADELGIQLEPRLKLLKVNEPPARKPGIRVNSVEELLSKLRAEEGITL
jgi:electron transfer flavoprotein beta subunit